MFKFIYTYIPITNLLNVLIALSTKKNTYILRIITPKGSGAQLYRINNLISIILVCGYTIIIGVKLHAT